MTRLCHILMFFLIALCSYGQHINFEKNINHKARNLEQNLSKNKDTLILVSQEKLISQVDILKEDFLKSIEINNHKAEIDLNILPIGNYIIQARIDRKRIVMYLEKTLDIKANLDTDVKIAKADQNISSPKPRQESQKQKIRFWVVYETNSNFGSSKSMSLKSKADVYRLISKNKLELKSEIGKDNTLVVYEVYNTSKFMKRQLRNPDYYKSKHSNVFNEEPFYSSAHTIKP